jgi:hypothetical protein
LFARLNRYARYACAPMAALALWAVLVATLPAAANAEETPTRTNARANDQDTAHRTARYVVVAPGDSLWSISEGQLGPSATGAQIARGVERIYALNRDLIGADPDLIFAGQRFALPRSLGRHGAGRHASGQAPRQAREQSRAAHQKAPAARPQSARTDRGTESGSVRAAKFPVAAHVPDAREGGTLPDEVAAPRVPAVGQLTAGASPSSPASYLDGVRARISSAASRLIDAVVTDDRYAARQLLGWALILISLGMGAFSIVRATRPWRAIARRERQKRRRERAAAPYAAAAPVAEPAITRERERPPGETRSVRSEDPRRPKDPAGPAHGGNAGGSSPGGLRRNTGVSGPRRGSASRTRQRMMNRRRKVVGENQQVPDSGREWQIGEGLRHSIGGIPLRPDTMEDVLAVLKPQVEEELQSVTLVKRRRNLSDREHRQANALRDLLALAQENPNSKRRA